MDWTRSFGWRFVRKRQSLHASSINSNGWWPRRPEQPCQLGGIEGESARGVDGWWSFKTPSRTLYAP